MHWAKVGILDTVGVTLAGSNEQAPRLLANVLMLGQGPSLIFGSARALGRSMRRSINGTASHALDFDDCNNTLGGHPSAPILPALFALADEIGASGRDFITAYVAGFETECKIALGRQLLPVHQGLASDRDARRVRRGGGVRAAHGAGWRKNRDGARDRRVARLGHQGELRHDGEAAARRPLRAQRALRRRLSRGRLHGECAAVFEHKQGYFEVFNGPGNYDVGAQACRVGAPFDIVKPGIAIKQYPCCGSTHPAIDAMLQITRGARIEPAAVERIESWTHARRLEAHQPAAAGERARREIQRAVRAGTRAPRPAVAIEHFEGESWRDARIAALLPRIQVAPYDDARFPGNHFGGEVS